LEDIKINNDVAKGTINKTNFGEGVGTIKVIDHA
jgi:hypothetical protein